MQLHSLWHLPPQARFARASVRPLFFGLATYRLKIVGPDPIGHVSTMAFDPVSYK